MLSSAQSNILPKLASFAVVMMVALVANFQLGLTQDGRQGYGAWTKLSPGRQSGVEAIAGLPKVGSQGCRPKFRSLGKRPDLSTSSQ